MLALDSAPSYSLTFSQCSTQTPDAPPPTPNRPHQPTPHPPTRDLPPRGTTSVWLPLFDDAGRRLGEGEVLVDVSYKPFVDDDQVRAAWKGGMRGGEGRGRAVGWKGGGSWLCIVCGLFCRESVGSCLHARPGL